MFKVSAEVSRNPKGEWVFKMHDSLCRCMLHLYCISFMPIRCFLLHIQILTDAVGRRWTHTCSACRRQRPALPALPLPNSYHRMGTSLIQLLWTCALFLHFFFSFSEWELVNHSGCIFIRIRILPLGEFSFVTVITSSMGAESWKNIQNIQTTSRYTTCANLTKRKEQLTAVNINP